MAVRMRIKLARPWVGVRVCHLLLLVVARILDSERNLNRSADPMIRADRGLSSFWAGILDFGRKLAHLRAGCQAVKKMTINSDATSSNQRL